VSDLPRRALIRFGIVRRLLWRRRLPSEVDFWAAWLAGAPGTEEWADDRRLRLDPETEIRDPLVGDELDRIAADHVSILDVGAGPLTRLGYRYPGKTLEIVATDPLADLYDRLLRETNLDPPVRTIGVAGEDLVQHFGRNRFDLAYATNALDHSAEPVQIIENMVDVVRPGGVVLLRHKRNEGASARYGGLHQWNFDAEGGDLVVWNGVARVGVGAALAGRAETAAWLEGAEVLARIAVTERASAGSPPPASSPSPR
jgi:SAM-dependent methyltransferase